MPVGHGGTRVRRRGWTATSSRTCSPPQDEAGYACALIRLLGLNGLRVSEACSPDVGDLGGARYQPTLRIVGKADKPPRSR